MRHNTTKDVSWGLKWVYMMVYIRDGLPSHIPFIGCKPLTVRQKSCNDIHRYYGAWVEYWFAGLWSWRVVRDIWLGSYEDLSVFARCARLRLQELSCNGGGGGGFSWVGGSKALDPPLYNSEGFLVGLLPPLLSLVRGALCGCLLMPLSTLSSCRHHAEISLWLWGIRWIL